MKSVVGTWIVLDSLCVIGVVAGIALENPSIIVASLAIGIATLLGCGLAAAALSHSEWQ